MNWQELFWSLVIGIVLPFGPLVFVWWRYTAKRPLEEQTLLAVMCWTAFMLAGALYREHRANKWREEACANLGAELNRSTADDDDAYERLPTACKLQEFEADEG